SHSGTRRLQSKPAKVNSIGKDEAPLSLSTGLKLNGRNIESSQRALEMGQQGSKHGSRAGYFSHVKCSPRGQEHGAGARRERD
ncbi:hypothetical protein BaRGS_00025745, partial [Batillaria attramentaria]